ncbi:MAG: type III secretion system chaperone [Alphaproteobacteria bacterium]|nr:type III secretion system chaperone [Alphaproteobacteria bacterium]
MQAARKLVKALARHIGLQELVLDESGQCTLAFDETIVLSFVGDADEGLNVVSLIAEIDQPTVQVLSKLLEHNFVPKGLGGGHVAMQPDSNRVVLVQRWDCTTLDFNTFTVQLEDFVNAVEALRMVLEGNPAQSHSESNPSASSPQNAPPPGSLVG